MNCIICNDNSSKLVIKDYPGYIENSFFNIFYCSVCDTSFMDISKYDPEIYNNIYNNANNNPKSIRGYDRYIKYSKEIKSAKDPFKYLLEEENTYFPIYKFLNGKKNLKILEIGCGLGYLTYCINNLGHDVIGTDLSEEVIELAKSNFGDMYLCSDILNEKSLKENSFDLIIGTELIEHLPDIRNFIKKCKTLLKNEGSMIFTTPNKKAMEFISSSFWVTDNPPVHTCWLSESSFKYLSVDLDLQLEFLETKNPYFKHNCLIPYLYFKYYKSYKLVPSGISISSQNNKSTNIIEIFKKLSDLPLLRNICNHIYYKIVKTDFTLNALFRVKK